MADLATPIIECIEALKVSSDWSGARSPFARGRRHAAMSAYPRRSSGGGSWSGSTAGACTTACSIQGAQWGVAHAATSAWKLGCRGGWVGYGRFLWLHRRGEPLPFVRDVP